MIHGGHHKLLSCLQFVQLPSTHKNTENDNRMSMRHYVSLNKIIFRTKCIGWHIGITSLLCLLLMYYLQRLRDSFIVIDFIISGTTSEYDIPEMSQWFLRHMNASSKVQWPFRVVLVLCNTNLGQLQVNGSSLKKSRIFHLLQFEYQGCCSLSGVAPKGLAQCFID